MLNMILNRYLSNLKERDELDYIFAPLLESMGYQILKKPSQGQPEYGKDYITIYYDCNKNEKYLVHFQLKAGNDKDLNSRTFTKENGVRESLLSAKDAKYEDFSIPDIKDLAIKIVLAHTGIINPNFVIQFNGFIEDNFNGQDEPKFERWDIHKLTELFSQHLFNEYLFTEKRFNLDLLKKTLTLLGSGDSDFPHFKELISSILSSCEAEKKGKVIQMLSTLNLIAQLVFQYSQEINNLHTAKEHVTYLMLQTWGWILENHLEQTEYVIKEYFGLFFLHYNLIDHYLLKFKDLYFVENGYYSDIGHEFESIAYPLRCSEIINNLIYYYYVTPILFNKIQKNELTELEKIIEFAVFNNVGSTIPLFDNYSVTLLNIVNFFDNIGRPDLIKRYMHEVFNNLSIIKSVSKRLPELKNNMDYLIEFIASKERPAYYQDNSSYLLSIMLEISARRGYDHFFEEYYDYLRNNNGKVVNFLVYHPPSNLVENEHILFQKELVEEGSTSVFSSDLITSSQKSTESIDVFLGFCQKDGMEEFELRTEKTPFKFLLFLAHSYYLTPYFPSTWRGGGKS
ncbi:MAG TPA: hypothetical protein GXX77_01060 [Candidatus Cloacimonetes bacterium]|nr:hypothetical protein [Candidatus Cloacimonadota bacterium]